MSSQHRRARAGGEAGSGRENYGSARPRNQEGNMPLEGSEQPRSNERRQPPRRPQQPNYNFARPLRPESQQLPALKAEPVMIGGGGNGSGNSAYRAGPAGSQPTGRTAGAPPRPARPNYVPSFEDTYEREDAQIAIAQQSRAPVRPQPPQLRGPQQITKSVAPPPPAPRSIEHPPDSASAFRGASPDNRPVIPVPPVIIQAAQRKFVPPPVRRPAPSIPSFLPGHGSTIISPIPEERSNPSVRGSYASSAAIPQDWESDAPEYFALSMAGSDSSDGSETGQLPMEGEVIEQGLVRQASLGKRSKPRITQIKGPLQSPRSIASSDDLEKGTHGDGGANMGMAVQPIPVSTLPQAMKSTTSLALPKPVSPQEQSPASTRSSFSSPLAQPPAAVLREDHPGFSEKPISRQRSRTPEPAMSLAMAKELGLRSDGPRDDEHPVTSTAKRGSIFGIGKTSRRMPPRINIDAVREAESRGSLTSLPDLIRRATKLAAVLDTGRPESTKWGRGSFAENLTSSRSGARDTTDSLSDILASFPPPLAHGRRNTGFSRLSGAVTPLTSDEENLNEKNGGRRLCGMPLWLFILIVCLGLVIITAAIVIPVHLLSLSKKSSTTQAAFSTSSCTGPESCLNGGESIMVNGSCGCVCTNGFTGPTCAAKETEDSSCTLIDVPTTSGTKKSSIGSALPRLLEKAQPSYNITLDSAKLVAAFSKANVSCTLQNALITFNGRTQPENVKLRSRELVVDNSPPPESAAENDAAATPATIDPVTKRPVLNGDVLDFARIGVLYLAEAAGIEDADQAQQTLNAKFRGGVDTGSVTSGNWTFELTERRIVIAPEGTALGKTKPTPSPTPTPPARS